GGTLRLDRDVATNGRLSLSYNSSRMTEHAFQLVAGMNPDTEIHSHRARIGYTLAPDALTEISIGGGFDRNRSVLIPEPNAVGERVRFGFQIQELGPDAEFPVDRVLNIFRGGAHVSRRFSGGRHTLSFGGEAFRTQLNSFETRDVRGYFVFSNNFGRRAVANLLEGTPSFYAGTVGFIPRGFRNSSANLYLSDRIQLRPGLQLDVGLRYSLTTRPTEVNQLDQIPYDCDCNNFAPRLALAWQAPGGWTA
ncbi:MAG: TonB-dependent receptor, partial [bacterium]|nr:TonB-dependent receptor [bacterium]